MHLRAQRYGFVQFQCISGFEGLFECMSIDLVLLRDKKVSNTCIEWLGTLRCCFEWMGVVESSIEWFEVFWQTSLQVEWWTLAFECGKVCVEHKGAHLSFRVAVEALQAQRCYIQSKIIKKSVCFEGWFEWRDVHHGILWGWGSQGGGQVQWGEFPPIEVQIGDGDGWERLVGDCRW